MSSAYRALESKRPRLSGETIVDLSNLVSRRQHTTVGEGDSFGKSLGATINSLRYIVDGLTIFRKIAPTLSKEREILSELSHQLQFVRTTRRLSGVESNPSLKPMIDSLNIHRTYFFDGITDNSATVKPYLDAVTSIIKLIPLLSECNNYLSAAHVHPLLDNSGEVIENSLEALKMASAKSYDVNYESSGPNLFENGKVLPDPWEEEVIETPSVEISWANEKPYLDVIDNLFFLLGNGPLENATKTLSQVTSLYTVRPENTLIKKNLTSEYAKVAVAWEHIADRVQVLLYIVQGVSQILEKSVDVTGEYLFQQFEEEDPMLNLVMARFENLLGKPNGSDS